MKIVTFLSTATDKHFTLIFRMLISDHVFMSHFPICKLQTKLRLVIHPVLWHPLIWMLWNFTTTLKANYWLNKEQFVLLSCQLVKIFECTTVQHSFQLISKLISTVALLNVYMFYRRKKLRNCIWNAVKWSQHTQPYHLLTKQSPH